MIENIAPAVAIEQKVNTSNPRSTVGTSTELYEYLKLMFARIGRTYSPVSGVEVKRHSVSDVVDYVFTHPKGTRITIFAPLLTSKEHPLRPQLEMLHQEGFMRVAVKGTVVRIEDYLPGCSDELKTLFKEPKGTKREIQGSFKPFFPGENLETVKAIKYKPLLTNQIQFVIERDGYLRVTYISKSDFNSLLRGLKLHGKLHPSEK